jgi:hypothetical protein
MLQSGLPVVTGERYLGETLDTVTVVPNLPRPTR